MSQENSKIKSPAKKGLLGWIIEFAGEKKGWYITSVFFALLSVACCIAPYFMIARIVQQLLAGGRDWSMFLRECGIVALFWLGNVLFHAISTSMSHVATFNLLGNIRKKMCDKLTRLPLGTVLDMPSGSLKNIMIERVDSMETTLAHIVPEYTSNIVLSLALTARIITVIKTEASTIPLRNIKPPIGSSVRSRDGVITIAIECGQIQSRIHST